MRKGFTLVELSIVLVILGLLVGGVLAGQSLIRAAELRAVISEYQRYIAAAHTFRDKYFALPGDMTNATAFWGKDNTYCAGHTGTAATNGTCNGDGNGTISWAGGATQTGESMQFWKHLALAGIIEGSYTGISTTCYYCGTMGTTTPKSKISNGGWSIAYIGAVSGHIQWYDGNYGNTLYVGSFQGYTSGMLLKPEEAWNIDTKLDDGKPGIGKVRAWKSAVNPGCTDTDTITAVYALSSTAITCSFNMEGL